MTPGRIRASTFGLLAVLCPGLFLSFEGSHAATVDDLLSVLTGAKTQVEGDLTGDGEVDFEDLFFVASTWKLEITQLLAVSPEDGETDVAVTRETILRFTQAIEPETIHSESVLASFGGAPLSSRFHLSPNGKTLTLFYDDPLPPSSLVRVIVDGDLLRDVNGGRVDADSDGIPGGVGLVDFETLTLTVLEGTAVFGRVFASELATVKGGTGETNVPLGGVRITVDGMEEILFTETDSLGNFRLEPAPVGKFFVHVDGRTVSEAFIDEVTVATSFPEGPYYPFVGKPWTSVAGRETDVGDVYLPLVTDGSLKPVSQMEDTTIGFADQIVSAHSEFSEVSITVPANSLFADDGTQGGLVGIAPVPPSRLPGTLPPGLEFPVVITVQTAGTNPEGPIPTNFDTPAPVCFPNLPDPITGAVLSPGETSFLYSFNHDSGVWEVVGSMTVSEDGSLICSDPGSGILAPGWHGSGPPPFGPPPCRMLCCSGGIGGFGGDGGDDDDDDDDGGGGGGGGDDDDDDVPQMKASDFHSDPSILLTSFDPTKRRRRCERKKPCDFRDCVRGCQNKLAKCVKKVEIWAMEWDASCRSQCGGNSKCYSRCIKPAIKIQKRRRDACYRNHRRCITRTCQRCSVKTQSEVFLPKGTVEDPFIQQIEDLLDQADALLAPYDLDDEIPDAVGIELLSILDMIHVLTGNDPIGDLTRREIESEIALENSQADEEFGDTPDYPIRYVAEIFRGTDTLYLRGETDAYAQFSLFTPADGRLQYMSFYDPLTRTIGYLGPELWRGPQFKGQGVIIPDDRFDRRFRLPRFFLDEIDPNALDTEGDGLPDSVELVYGTDPENPDSDFDGIPDGAEVDQGTNPLDGFPVRTGIISTADTPGTAVDVCAVNNMAILADSDRGVSVFNVFNGMEPTIIAQVDTPGDANRVACSGTKIAVTDGAFGLAIVEIADPPSATIEFQIPLGGAAISVEAVSDVAFVGTDTGLIVVVDLLTGGILDRHSIGGTINDLKMRGEFLYALTEDTLYALTPFSETKGAGSSVASPFTAGPNRRLFVGDRVLYTVHGKGYNTFDISDPSQPLLVAAGDSEQFGWKQIAINGSGHGIAAVGPNEAFDGPHHVSAYDVSSPSETNLFLNQFETPGIARSVTLFNALAYVADHQNGLQVINYLSYDNQGIEPEISLSANFPLDPPEVEEGKAKVVVAHVTDDVQVRNVEFYLDGERALTDGNFPFEFRFVAPRLIDQATFSLRGKATDTGGNFVWTDEIVLTLTPDETPPRITHVNPTDGAYRGNLRTVAVYFSEPMKLETINDQTVSIAIIGKNHSSSKGLPSFTPVFRESVLGAFLTFEAPLDPGEYEISVSNVITDLAGNPLEEGRTWSFTVYDTEGDSDGDCLPDEPELELGLDPSDPDSNNDGILDGDEDTDIDGLINCEERLAGLDPGNPDTDGDLLNDGDEIELGTNPLDFDSDDDGFLDGEEVEFESGPLDAESLPIDPDAQVTQTWNGSFTTRNEVDPIGPMITQSFGPRFTVRNDANPIGPSINHSLGQPFTVQNQANPKVSGDSP